MIQHGDECFKTKSFHGLTYFSDIYQDQQGYPHFQEIHSVAAH